MSIPAVTCAMKSMLLCHWSRPGWSLPCRTLSLVTYAVNFICSHVCSTYPHHSLTGTSSFLSKWLRVWGARLEPVHSDSCHFLINFSGFAIRIAVVRQYGQSWTLLPRLYPRQYLSQLFVLCLSFGDLHGLYEVKELILICVPSSLDARAHHFLGLITPFFPFFEASHPRQGWVFIWPCHGSGALWILPPVTCWVEIILPCLCCLCSCNSCWDLFRYDLSERGFINPSSNSKFNAGENPLLYSLCPLHHFAIQSLHTAAHNTRERGNSSCDHWRGNECVWNCLSHAWYSSMAKVLSLLCITAVGLCFVMFLPFLLGWETNNQVAAGFEGQDNLMDG